MESCPLRLNLRKCFTEVTKFCQQIARMLAIDAGIYGRAGEMLIIDASSVLTLLGSLIRPVTGAYFLNKTKKDFFLRHIYRERKRNIHRQIFHPLAQCPNGPNG